MPATLLIIFLAISTRLLSQSATSSGVSASLVSPASVIGTFTIATLEKDNSSDVSTTLFSQSSSKNAQRSSFRLPIIKQKINFATIKLNNTNTVVDISLPATVVLKSKDGSEAVIAYQFEHRVDLAAGVKHAKGLIQLSAFVASATDQQAGVYSCEPVEVVVNYN